MVCLADLSKAALPGSLLAASWLLEPEAARGLVGAAVQKLTAAGTVKTLEASDVAKLVQVSSVWCG